MLRLSTIYLYPIKSAAGQTLAHAQVEARGLRGDRRWMLVDRHGRFMTARQHPRLTQVQVDGNDQELRCRGSGQEPLVVAKPAANDAEIEVQVWRDRTYAYTTSSVASQWFSRHLDQDCQLVYMGDQHRREVDANYGQTGDIVSFADGFPLLLISQASLDDLNNRLQQPVSMAAFRPNLVVTGCPPYAEDRWRRLRIGSVILQVAKPCSRCVMTTINPATGHKSAHGEPLRTLLGYRRQGTKAMFGQNLCVRSSGPIDSGQAVEILD